MGIKIDAQTATFAHQRFAYKTRTSDHQPLHIELQDSILPNKLPRENHHQAELREENKQERKFIITYTYSMETEFTRRKELRKIEKKLKHHMFELLCVLCLAQCRLLENANDLVPDGILNVPWLASLDIDLITRSCQPELDANNTCTVCTMVKL